MIVFNQFYEAVVTPCDTELDNHTNYIFNKITVIGRYSFWSCPLPQTGQKNLKLEQKASFWYIKTKACGQTSHTNFIPLMHHGVVIICYYMPMGHRYIIIYYMPMSGPYNINIRKVTCSNTIALLSVVRKKTKNDEWSIVTMMNWML